MFGLVEPKPLQTVTTQLYAKHRQTRGSVSPCGPGADQEDDMETPDESWIVLGSREHGVSYGPFTEDEARRFAAPKDMIALPLSGACAQLETCVAYGLPYRPRRAA